MAMGKLSSKVQRLRGELQKLNTATLGRADLTQLTDRVAKLVLEALDDEHHRLSANLTELRDWITLNRAPRVAKVKKSTAPSPDARAEKSSPAPSLPKPVIMSERHLFLPQPGTMMPLRHLWPLQLLLFTAACSSKDGAGLARRLDLTEDQLVTYAQDAAQVSVAMWSPLQYAQYLEQAIGWLDFPDAPPRLDGRTLISKGKRIRLSRQQALLVRLLLEQAGKYVSHEALRQGGVNDPVKIMGDLRKKLRQGEIELDIHSRAGAYMIADA